MRNLLSQPFRSVVQATLLIAAVVVIGRWLSTAPDKPVMVLSLVVASAWSRVRLPDVAQQVQRGWLGSLALSALARSLLIVLLTALPVIGFTVLAGVVAGAFSASPMRLGLMLVVAVPGALAAAALPHPARLQPYPASRYRRRYLERDGTSGLLAIGHDLHACVAARMRPDALARACVPLLLLLPNQIPASAVLVLTPMVPALVYAGFLLSVLPAYLTDTHRWLASAAVSRAQLARLYRRTLWPRFALIVIGVMPFLTITAASSRAGWFALAGALAPALLLERYLRTGLYSSQ